MKKLSKFFAVLLALVTIGSFPVMANAASVDEGALQAKVQAEEGYSHQLAGVGPKFVRIDLSISSTYEYSYYVEVVIYNKNKKKIRRVYHTSYAIWSNLKKNSLYYYRTRLVYREDDTYTPVSKWSKYIPFVCAEIKYSVRWDYSNGTKEIVFKIPKIKGIKKCRIYVSKKKKKGYKKMATVKVGKKVKGKLKMRKTYYVVIVPNKGTNVWGYIV